MLRGASLFFVLGLALAYAVELALGSDWVSGFLRENELGSGGRRALLLSMFGTGAAFAAAAFGVAVWLQRTGKDPRRIELWGFRLSPLALLAALPVLFRHAPWIDRPLALLLTTALFALLFEGALLRSLARLPEAAPAWTEKVRAAFARVDGERLALGSVVAASAVYSLALSRLGIRRHHSLQSGTFDLGISDNLMYNALAGEFMRSPIFSGTGPKATDFLANHAQFGQYVLLPVYALLPRSETLIAMQCTLLGFSAVFLYLFSRKRLAAGPSALLSLAYLAYPAIHGASLYEMTYIPIASFFVFMTVWALDAKRWVWFGFGLAAALSMREDIPVGLAVAGVTFALAGHRPRAGLCMALVSLVYFVVVRFVIMDSAGSWIFPKQMYADFLPEGEPVSFRTVILTLLTNPVYVLSKLLKEEKVVYMLTLLAPLCFLPLRRAWFLVALVPGTLLTLLTTNYEPTIQVGFHYAMHFTPYLFLMSAVALATIQRSDPALGTARLRAAVGGVLLASATIGYQLGALAESPRFRVGFGYHDFEYTDQERDRYGRLTRLLSEIPPDASVAASNAIGPHVSNRKEAYLADHLGAQGAEYVAIARMDYKYGKNRKHLRRLLEGDQYGVVAFDKDFVLLRKGHKTDDNEAALKKLRP